MFWRPGKGDSPGQWHGPARVIIQESDSVLWLSFSSRVYRVAPEHVRCLSEREASRCLDQMASGPMTNPSSELGKGVFQYEDLTEQTITPPPMPTDDNGFPNVPHNPTGPNSSNPSAQELEIQPDAEPSIVPPSNVSSGYAPTTPLNDHEENAGINQHPNLDVNQPIEIPVPEAGDDELSMEDTWVVTDSQIFRIHRKPRNHAFDPSATDDCPVNLLHICGERSTTGHCKEAPVWNKLDEWGTNTSQWQTTQPWTGVTCFNLISTCNQTEIETPHDTLHIQPDECLTCEIFLTAEDIQGIQKCPTEFPALAATAAKRQRAEVKTKDLSLAEKAEFDKAKGKEIDQWLATSTVRKILRNRIPEQNILRCRWVLTWKDLDEHDALLEGKNRKAKARLVILGYEDPNITEIPRDSPTLQKESRALLMQLCASRKWVIRSFDIKTAFLRGSRRDNRVLGLEPPAEMRDKLQLEESEIVELLKSAYGLVNAPYLWYQELKEQLLDLGFCLSPLDPCLFALTGKEGQVHGLIGMHVDDGLCCGDSTFLKTIDLLEAKFPFGSKREKEFTFTGIQIYQDDDFNIHLNQTEYVRNIEAISIDRHRRKSEELLVTESERQSLRGLIGSLQYASTNTRPDLAAKLSFLQSKITCATIHDLLEANRILGEAKKYSNMKITIHSIPEEDIRMMPYSDASFATRSKQQSQKGGLFLAAHKNILNQQSATASPLVWYSKKIERVVASTLAAETYALSAVVDLIDWLRLAWEWIRNPAIPWQKPEEVWSLAPPSLAVIDCKSLYDVINKNTTPQCQEHRTLIEALVIKHHVKCGIQTHWVHSAAQLADALTKSMDCYRLRQFLAHCTCCLHDIQEVLKDRADRKAIKTWLSDHALNQKSGPEVTYFGVKDSNFDFIYLNNEILGV